MELKISYPVRNPPRPPETVAKQWALLVGARCHAQGFGDTEQEAHAALVTEARELHGSLGLWLAEQDAAARAVESADHGVEFQGPSPRGRVYSVMTRADAAEQPYSGTGDFIEGAGDSRSESLEVMRRDIVALHASHWAAYARALKGGE